MSRMSPQPAASGDVFFFALAFGHPHFGQVGASVEISVWQSGHFVSAIVVPPVCLLDVPAAPDYTSPGAETKTPPSGRPRPVQTVCNPPTAAHPFPARWMSPCSLPHLLAGVIARIRPLRVGDRQPSILQHSGLECPGSSVYQRRGALQGVGVTSELPPASCSP